MQPKSTTETWQVYMIEATDGLLYTGVSTDAERRFIEHTRGGTRGAKFFRGRQPKRLVYLESGHTRSGAHQREAAIKQLTRTEKLALIETYSGSNNTT
jgi:putative endonuclease